MRQQTDFEALTADGPGLLYDWQVAQILGMSISRVRHWRLEDKGPKWFKDGYFIWYPKSELRKYMKRMSRG